MKDGKRSGGWREPTDYWESLTPAEKNQERGPSFSGSDLSTAIIIGCLVLWLLNILTSCAH